MLNINKIKEDFQKNYDLKIEKDLFFVQNELNYIYDCNYENYKYKDKNNFKRDLELFEFQKTKTLPIITKLLKEINNNEIIFVFPFSSLYPLENVKILINEENILKTLKKFRDYGWIQNDVDINKKYIDYELIKILKKSRILLYHSSDLSMMKFELIILEEKQLKFYKLSEKEFIVLNTETMFMLSKEGKIIYLFNDLINQLNHNPQSLKLRYLDILDEELRISDIDYRSIYNYFEKTNIKDFKKFIKFISVYYENSNFEKYIEKNCNYGNEILNILKDNYMRNYSNKTEKPYYLYDNGQLLSEFNEHKNIYAKYKLIGVTDYRKEKTINYEIFNLEQQVCIVLKGLNKIDDYILEINNNYDHDNINQFIITKHQCKLDTISEFVFSVNEKNDFIIVKIDKNTLNLKECSETNSNFFFLSIILKEKIGLRYHVTAGTGWYTTPLKINASN